MSTPNGSGELRVGLVGGGRLAEVGYLPALRAAQGVRLVAVAELDPARRRRVATLGELPDGYPDAATLLADAAIDALVIATPAAAHLADARLAAAAAVPTLVEKPPAADLAEAGQLAELTPAPWIGFNRRFETGIARLRATTPPGGEVGLRLEIGYRRSGWGAHSAADDALLDLGPHLVDLARWITRAEVTDVRRATVSPGRAGFDLVLGAARARIRCATDLPYRELIEIRHRDGTRVGQHRRGGLVAAVRDRIRPPGTHPLVASLTAQLEAFARAVHGAPEPTLGRATDGLAVMTVLESVRAAAGRGVPA
ncbi:MAG TPA: Gfo/Idh/MocA family oxidoreductase [Pseudonocardia sp.]|nr:Gfo/Idh/MocA family oxidoreductase [Pseudonocardia sp.]